MIYHLIGIVFISLASILINSIPIYIISYTIIISVTIYLFNKKPKKEEKKEEKSFEFIEKNKLKEKEDKILTFLKSIINKNNFNLREKIKKDNENELLISLEDYINFILDSLHEVISWIVNNTENLSIHAAQINFYSTRAKDKSEKQIDYALKIIQIIQKLLESFREIVSKSKEAFEITDKAKDIYLQGTNIMKETIENVGKLDTFIKSFNNYLEDLKKFTLEISKILSIISEMANKTNVLSINASIEAARAGEAGKGFKIVAQEIRSFSTTTAEASQKIHKNIKELNERMKHSFLLFEESNKIITSVTENTAIFKKYFDTLSSYILKSIESTESIHDIASKEISDIEEVNSKIEDIKKTISDFKQDFEFLSKAAEDITHTGEKIVKNVNNFEIENYQAVVKHVLQNQSKKITELFESKVKKGILKKEDIFDTNYVPIPNTNPQKYHTKYDTIIENELQEILEETKEILTREAIRYKKQFLACAITDINGYAPIHLKALSQPETGDYQKDLAFSRHKRIYNDPVSLKSAQNTEDVLFQVYMRDTGVQNADISVPVYIFGRHYGGFRAGYILSSENNK